MTALTKAEAKSLWQKKWREWSRGKPQVSEQDMFLFYGEYKQEDSYALSFRHTGDAWQTVHAWLIEAERMIVRN